MLCVCNFADEGYAVQQRLNTKSAYKKGKADKVFEYHPSDLIELKAKYPDHFKIKRGYGLWFWKPFLILKAMEQMADGDICSIVILVQSLLRIYISLFQTWKRLVMI